MNMIKFPFTLANRSAVTQRLFGLDWTQIADLLSKWPEGTKGYITFHKEGKLKSSEQLGYYYALILPAAFRAFKESGDVVLSLWFKDRKVDLELTSANVDLFLKLRYADYSGVYMDKADMTMAHCAAYEDFCIRWLAQWMNVHIPPADPDWREKVHETMADTSDQGSD